MSRDWVTFDCYGTLADWLGGMRGALERHVGADQAERGLRAHRDLAGEGEAGRRVRAYRDLEAGVEPQRRAPAYREVLTETLRGAAERERIALPPGAERT